MVCYERYSECKKDGKGKSGLADKEPKRRMVVIQGGLKSEISSHTSTVVKI